MPPRQTMVDGNRLVNVLIAFRRWIRGNNLDPSGEAPFKITIEAPDPVAAAAMLYRLKSEIEPVMMGDWRGIDLNRDQMIMGILVRFTIKDDQPLPDIYWPSLPKFPI